MKNKKGDKVNNINGNGSLNGNDKENIISKIGLVEWFHLGDYDHVELAINAIQELGIKELRTGISWADYFTPEGKDWYDWLIPKLAEVVQILPCFLYTPPHLGVEPKTSSPPQNPKDFADFLDVIITRYGQHFEYVELWNEPNNRSEYDYTLDKGWHTFCKMIGGAAYWMKQRGKKTVLGGMSPIDPNWLQMIADRGVMQYIDAVGIHAFPDVFDSHWLGWNKTLNKIQSVLDNNGLKTEIWITETGYSTWNHDERKQLSQFIDAMNAPVKKMYWYGLKDLDPHYETVDGFHLDEREYHFGLLKKNCDPKLLYRILKNNHFKEVAKKEWMTASYKTLQSNKPKQNILITGGAGFVGVNLAHRLLKEGYRVTIFDNLSREGVIKNIEWLKEEHKKNLTIEVGDIRNKYLVNDLVASASAIFHFAAQVAVTTSLVDPMHDFSVNVAGSLNLLDALRQQKDPAPIIFTSTNKVYGGLEDVKLRLNDSRYEPQDQQILKNGVSEARPLDFHSPYGCSKGAADQYIVDFARSMGIKSCVFRMSCIYGPHQYGNEDQGWVAHFLISALKKEEITIYGDGKQVRDILYVDDLVDAFLLAWKNIDKINGQAFNIGGGAENIISLIDLINIIETLNGEKIDLSFGDWRPGDQKYYVSDTRKFQQATGWYPQTNYQKGIENLYEWVMENIPSVSKTKKLTAAALK